MSFKFLKEFQTKQKLIPKLQPKTFLKKPGCFKIIKKLCYILKYQHPKRLNY